MDIAQHVKVKSRKNAYTIVGKRRRLPGFGRLLEIPGARDRARTQRFATAEQR
jgi:hypothetical protein